MGTARCAGNRSRGGPLRVARWGWGPSRGGLACGPRVGPGATRRRLNTPDPLRGPSMVNSSTPACAAPRSRFPQSLGSGGGEARLALRLDVKGIVGGATRLWLRAVAPVGGGRGVRRGWQSSRGSPTRARAPPPCRRPPCQVHASRSPAPRCRSRTGVAPRLGGWAPISVFVLHSKQRIILAQARVVAEVGDGDFRLVPKAWTARGPVGSPGSARWGRQRRGS